MSTRRYKYRPMKTKFPSKSVDDDFLKSVIPSLPDYPTKYRKRIYDPKTTLLLMMQQAIHRNASCSFAVSAVSSFVKSTHSVSTSSYCNARKRLSTQWLKDCVEYVSKQCDNNISGRPIRAIDGTTFTVADSDENRCEWSYSSGQKEGCGFPVMGALAVYSLDSGAIMSVHPAPWKSHDVRLFFDARDAFHENEIIVGDRAFGGYSVLAMLKQKNCDGVMRMHHARKLPNVKDGKIGDNEWIVTWKKGVWSKHSAMSEEIHESLDDEIKVRIIYRKIARKGFRIKDLWIVTTLLDKEEYPSDYVLNLYLKRWKIEVSFRDIKTTMRYDMIRSKSPQVVVNEMLAAILAYNIARLSINRAGQKEDCGLVYSLAGTLDAMSNLKRSWLFGLSNNRLKTFLRYVRKCKSLKRERSRYARAIKRRHKNYQLLTKPRELFMEIPHRSRYRKNA